MFAKIRKDLIINIFSFHLLRPTSNIGCTRYVEKMVIPVFCIYKIKKMQKINDCVM